MDISSLRSRPKNDSYSVSELNLTIKNLIESDRVLNAVSVYGEISNFTLHTNGHLYFTLKDDSSQIKAVMFRSSAKNLKFMPESGMKVNVRGSIGVYTTGGAYQLYVNNMTPDGIGSLYLAYEQLKNRLSEEGLFDESHKRILPKMPGKIGVITSPTGAAVRDIINVVGRRFPLADIYLYPSLVQGDGAEANLIEALDYFDKSSLVDVIIIGRGGGSIEDLWAFNSELLARRIFECKIPVISAVGHETDYTICDFVSDTRAPTPSAAAEIAVPDIRELYIRLDALATRGANALDKIAGKSEQRLKKARELTAVAKRFIDLKQNELKSVYSLLKLGMEKNLNSFSQKNALISGKLDALSPLKVLSRGYSVVLLKDRVIKDAEDLNEGDEISVKLSLGKIKCTVNKKEQ